MDKCLKWLCCCCDLDEQNPELPRRQNQNKKQRKPSQAKNIRIVTKYRREQFAQINEEQRMNKVKSYCCPICFLYFKRILACNECFNFICINCCEQYQRKNKTVKQEMKCPFCASIKCKFTDYQLDPHSYFDASKHGFITKEERERIDNEHGLLQVKAQQIGSTTHQIVANEGLANVASIGEGVVSGDI